MGVDNHAFILALVNPRLQGVDPFDTGLPLEVMMAIAYECSINPWYYFREIARAPATSGVGSNPLQANRGNITLFWLFFNHITTILIQIRQTGKSFSTDTLMVYLMNVLCKNTSINLLTKDDDLRRTNIKRIKDIIAELPAYLRQVTKNDANNGEEITVGRLNNRYNTHVPQASAKRALNMGRGLTTPIFHIDEPPFQPNISISLPAALAGLGAAVDEARLRGEPHGTIMTTTAGKRDDKDGAFIYGILQKATVWNERYFDAVDEEELRHQIKVNGSSEAPIVNITLNHRQLGKTDEWLRGKIGETHATGEAADRDYFNRWTSGSQSSPFTPDLTERVAKSRREMDFLFITPNYGYAIRWYIPEDQILNRLKSSSKIILGMDPSDAGGGDEISLVLTDPETLEVIGVGNYKEANLFNLANWVADFLTEFTNIIAVIERRSSGAAIMDQLLWLLPQRGIDPFKRMYNRAVNDYMENPERFKEIQVPMGRRPEEIYIRYKTLFGFATSGAGLASRTSLYSTTLQNGVRMAAERLNDIQLINQLLALEIRNGRVDHPQDGNDDLVIGWLMTVWFLTQGTNLQYYGLDPRSVLCSVRTKHDESNEEKRLRLEQEGITQQIKELCDEIADEPDDFVVMRLEDKLRKLDRSRVISATDVVSVDELIRQAREKKRENSRKRSLYNRNSNEISGYYNTTKIQQASVLSDRPMSMRDFR